MRLKERRERVKSLIAYKPESLVLDGDIDRALNDASAELWSRFAWTFTERTAQLDVIPDVTPETIGSAILLTVLNDQRLATFSAEVPDLRADVDNLATPGRTWVGHYLTIGARDYQIAAVTSVGSSTALVLEEPVRLEDSTASEILTDWKLKRLALPLPEDVAEVLSLVDADTPATAGGSAAKIPGLPARRAEDLDLRYDRTGTPECWIPATDPAIPAAGRITLACATSVNAAGNEFGFSGADRYVRLTWAFAKGGRIGPLAEPATVLVTGQTSRKITFSLFNEDGITPASTDAPDYTQRPYALANETWKKVLFADSNINPATGESKGIPRWRRVTRRTLLSTEAQGDGFPLEVLDTGSTGEINQAHQVHPGNPPLRRDPDGNRQGIRLYPRPADSLIDYPEYEYGPASSDAVARKERFRRYLLRYTARPFPMAEAGETDELPAEFHILTVQKAAATILRPLDPKMADTYEKRAEEALNSIANRYIARGDQELRRGQWGSSYDRPRFSTSVSFSRE